MSLGLEGDLATEAVALRRELHRLAELSGQEVATARLIASKLESLGPDRLATGVGGHGVLATFEGSTPGPSVILRGELDALPIPESLEVAYASETAGVAHKCGHDGHMATLVAVASSIARERPSSGRVTFLFEPAEETGEGARRVIEDPQFEPFRSEWALAFHNLPGFALGDVILRDGLFAFGSVGADIRFRGVESHAAEKELGNSPGPALAMAIRELTALGAADRLPPSVGAVTITHMRLGEPTFGTSPGSGRILATIRAGEAHTLDELRRDIERLAARIASEHGLDHHVDWREPFPPTQSDATLVSVVRRAATARGLIVVEPPEPFRWSEDFGHFGRVAKSVLFGLGAGTEQPALHRPDYDYPDSLVTIGAGLLRDVVHALTSPAGASESGADT